MTPQKDNLIQIKRLSSDSNYFNNVFKKTEKLLSVIFYILSFNEDKKDNNVLITLLKDKALATHAASLKTLRLLEIEASEGALALQYELVGMESTLSLAQAANLLPPPVANLLFEQLLNIERYLTNHYLQNTGISIDDNLGQSASTRLAPKSKAMSATSRRTVKIPKGDISSDAYMVYSNLNDRTQRIKTVLEAKPQATIKDIAEIITDVSEKTIQRELNSLIEKGQVLREGERRWSKYSVKK